MKGASMSMRQFKSRPPLNPGLPRLAGALDTAGYVTTGYIKNSIISPGRGFEHGFGLYERVSGSGSDHHSARELVDAALRWAGPMAALRAADADRPYFLYLHFLDPHVDYQPPKDWWTPAALAYDGSVDGSSSTLRDATEEQAPPMPEADRAQWRELYSSEVSFLDHQLGRLFGELAERGLYSEDTLVVFTADHGEQFGEHGDWEHGDLHIENVRVPLMVRAPGQAPGVRDETVSLIDVAPTILALLGLPAMEHAEGIALTNDASFPARVIVTEYGERRRVSDGRWGLLVSENGKPRLYDLAEDPGELRNVAKQHPDQLSRLLDALSRHDARSRVELEELDSVTTAPRDLDAIRELGY
jgi:arylsulfatase A-like enzyme